MTSQASDTAEWDRVWSSQIQGALKDSDPANVTLEDFWINAFNNCSERVDVLDIACGNGVLAGYMDEAMRRNAQDSNYLGVDSAHIDPPPKSRFKNLVPKFISNQPVEKVVLGKAKFDLIVSQFGFEYCDKKKIIELASTWIKPGGRMILVVHSSSSTITLESRQILEQLRLLENSALVPLIYRLFDRLDKISAGKREGDQEAEFLRGLINTTLTDLQSIGEKLHESKFLEATIALLLSLFSSKRAHIPPSILKENLTKLSRDLQHHQSRLKQQFASAMAREDLESLRKLQESIGFEKIFFTALHADTEELGQVIDSVFPLIRP